MPDVVPETCPRCKGWVYHRQTPCGCSAIYEAEALRSRLVLVRWSSRRWVVVRLREATIVGEQTVFAGDVVYGPNSLEDCEDAIRRTKIDP